MIMVSETASKHFITVLLVILFRCGLGQEGSVLTR